MLLILAMRFQTEAVFYLPNCYREVHTAYAQLSSEVIGVHNPQLEVLEDEGEVLETTLGHAYRVLRNVRGVHEQRRLGSRYYIFQANTSVETNLESIKFNGSTTMDDVRHLQVGTTVGFKELAYCSTWYSRVY